MVMESKDNSSDQRKNQLKKDLKEGLEGLQGIFIGAVALLATIYDSLIKSKLTSSITSYKLPKSQATKNSSLSIFQERETEDNSQPLEIEVEVEEKNKKKLLGSMIKRYIYPFLATVSTTALVAGVAKIDPLVQWANTQNECIEKTTTIDGDTPATLQAKVMNCNGGHLY